MPPTLGSALSETIQRLIAPPERLDDLTLLHRFASTRDEVSFGVLVRRHGGLVFDVCRNVLHDSADAEDAFQTTFVTLAQQANRLGPQRSLAGWLHTTAYRAALNAKRSRNRRRWHESRHIPNQVSESFDVAQAEERRALHEEVNRLPERYQAAIVLFYLTGKSQEEVGEKLGLTKEGVKKRLQRGRDRLNKALTRRGFGASAVLASAASTAILPETMAQDVVRFSLTYLEQTHLSGFKGLGEFMITCKSAVVTGTVMLALVAGTGFVWMNASAKSQTEPIESKTLQIKMNPDPERVTEEKLTIQPREIPEQRGKEERKTRFPKATVDQDSFVINHQDKDNETITDKLIKAAFPNDINAPQLSTKISFKPLNIIFCASRVEIIKKSDEVVLSDSRIVKYNKTDNRYSILFSGKSEKTVLKFDRPLSNFEDMFNFKLLSATIESDPPSRVDFQKP